MTAPSPVGPDGTSEAAIRVVLVDDHELIRSGLARAFEREPDMIVVGQAGSVGDALAVIEETQPTVIVTDLQLPDGSGLDLMRTVRGAHSTVGLVMLTMHSDDADIFAAMDAKASAFVGKDAPTTEVVSAARHAVTSPHAFVCAGLTAAMLRRGTEHRPALSAREREVLALLAEGLGTSAIAAALFMSESTVKTHIARIYHKLDATNRAQALVRSMKLGLLPHV